MKLLYNVENANQMKNTKCLCYKFGDIVPKIEPMTPFFYSTSSGNRIIVTKVSVLVHSLHTKAR